MKGLGLSPGMVNVLCSWARHFYLHSASFHLGVWMGISELAEKPAEMLKGNLVEVWYPTQGERGGGLVTLLVASSKISSGWTSASPCTFRSEDFILHVAPVK